MLSKADPHRRQPGRRRDVGRRQHAAVARDRGSECSTPYESPSVDRPRPAVHRARAATARRRRSTTATCASTTTSPPWTRRGSQPPTSFEQLAEPEYASRPGRRERRPRRRRDWRSCWRRSPSSATTAGSSTGPSSPTTACWSSTAGTRRTTTSFTRAGGDRPLVVSYGSSPPFEVLYSSEPLDRGAHWCRRRHVLPPDRVRRGTARHRQPGRRPPADRLPRLRALSSARWR